MPRFTVPRVAHCESGAGPGPSKVADTRDVSLGDLADDDGPSFGSSI